MQQSQLFTIIPIIDYDLVLLIQPMFMLGISIGVSLNAIFADWIITVLLVVLFIGKILCFYSGLHEYSNSPLLIVR